MKYTIEKEGEDAVIVFHNPLHQVKVTEGYATQTMNEKIKSGELKFGDEVFPNHKGFVQHLSEMNEMGLPMDTKEMIRLANIYNTPIPNLNFNGIPE